MSNVARFAQDDTDGDIELSGDTSLRAAYLPVATEQPDPKAAGIDFAGCDPSTSWMIAEVEMDEEAELGFRLCGASWISRFTDMERQAVSYRRGRVLLAGDAAYVQPHDRHQALRDNHERTAEHGRASLRWAPTTSQSRLPTCEGQVGDAAR